MGVDGRQQTRPAKVSKAKKGRKSYDRSWAWRIVYLSLGTLAGISAPAPTQVEDHVEMEHTPAGINYARARKDRFDQTEVPWTTRDSLRRDGRRATASQRRYRAAWSGACALRAALACWSYRVAKNCYGWGTVTPISNDFGAATFEKRLNELAHRLAATALRTGARVVQGYRGSGTATAGAVPYRS